MRVALVVRVSWSEVSQRARGQGQRSHPNCWDACLLAFPFTERPMRYIYYTANTPISEIRCMFTDCSAAIIWGSYRQHFLPNIVQNLSWIVEICCYHH